jgi:hypothetical protein
MRKLVAVALFVAGTLAGCGGGEEDQAASPEDKAASPENPNREACEYIASNVDGVDPTAEELDRIDEIATPQLAQDYRTLSELQVSENPTNLQGIVELASSIRAECANNGVVIPTPPSPGG